MDHWEPEHGVLGLVVVCGPAGVHEQGMHATGLQGTWEVLPPPTETKTPATWGAG